jgi:rhodanese-related sulfurtransferase
MSPNSAGRHSGRHTDNPGRPGRACRRTRLAATHGALGLNLPRLLTLLAITALLLGIAALVSSGCSSDQSGATTTVQAPAYTDIEPTELAEMLKNKDFLFINTHVPYEGEIEQTDLFIDYERAAELMSELPAEMNAKIVVYCRSDRMSRIAADVWAEAGYTNLYNLNGGFVAWEQAGYELLQKPQ